MSFFRKWKAKNAIRSPGADNMSAWVGALAHEIKNPLNTMKLNLQLLQEDCEQSAGTDNTKALKRLGTLGKEVDRLDEILNDFLRLARLSAPNLELTNISLLLDEFLDFIEPEAQESHIEVIREFAENLPEIHLDSGQISKLC